MPKGEPLGVVMIRNAGGGVGGLRAAMKAAGYLVAWGIVADALGHDPTWVEYRTYWKQSESTTAREVRAFKRCFGADAKVGEVWRRVSSSLSVDDRGQAVGELMAARWVA